MAALTGQILAVALVAGYAHWLQFDARGVDANAREQGFLFFFIPILFSAVAG